MDGDIGQLLGVGVQVDCTVGEDGHMVSEAHEEGPGDEGGIRFGLDDLEGGTDCIGCGVDGTGDQAIGPAHDDQHGAEVGGIGQLLTCLVGGHSLLGSEFTEFIGHGFQDTLVVHGLEGGLVKTGQPQLLAACQDGILFADDDQIDDVAGQQVVGGLDDAVLASLRQHNGLLVCLSSGQEVVLEGYRGGNLRIGLLNGLEHLVDVDIAAEYAVGIFAYLLSFRSCVEFPLGDGPDRAIIIPEDFLQGFFLLFLAP